MATPLKFETVEPQDHSGTGEERSMLLGVGSGRRSAIQTIAFLKHGGVKPSRLFTIGRTSATYEGRR